jgi:hypothetical protein
VYVQRSYHQTLSRVGSTVRKYVIAATNTDDVILFDLQEKIRTDLLDVPIPQPPAPAKPNDRTLSLLLLIVILLYAEVGRAVLSAPGLRARKGRRWFANPARRAEDSARYQGE